MVLPSQLGRPASSRAHMYRRRRGRLAPLAFLGLAIIGGGVIVWKLNSPPGNASADSTTSADSSTSENAPIALSSVTGSPAPAAGSSDSKRAASTGSASKPTGSSAVDPPKLSMGPPPATNTNNATRQTNAPPSPTPAKQPTASTPKPDAKAEAPTATPGNSGTAGGGSGGSGSASPSTQPTPTNQLVSSRKTLSDQLAKATGKQAADLRRELAALNDRLVFSPEIVSGDPFASSHTIQEGDRLSRLPKSKRLNVDWRFLQRINRLSAPERIQIGQKLKLISGPFHAVVHKKDFRMDLYMGEGANKVYVRSFNVGLGEFDSTPVGLFIVRSNSKLINPTWVNPRTGEKFAADDPTNPIGEHWIGLDAMSENLTDVQGYGIHGTIDPDSIGQQRSMGCVRMAAEDVALVYELLVDGVSTVEIRAE